MKKLGICALGALLVVMFALPAAAVEHEFGGYWRTRAYNQTNFTGEDDTEAQDIQRTDTRTRLYYDAVINDNLKLVNKFEFDAVWGDSSAGSYGDLGTDGVAVEVKHSYAEFTMDNWLFRVGAQGFLLARGFLQDNDGIGLLAMYSGDTFAVPFVWEKVDEGTGAGGEDANEGDIDAYVLTPTFHLSEALKINPYILYLQSTEDSKGGDSLTFDEISWGNLGVDIDFAADAFSLWFTGIFQFGTVEVGGEDADLSGYLFAIGGNTTVGPAGIHGQFVYAAGDDDPADDDMEMFLPPPGAASYYWSEIMGLGTFDNQVSNNSCADAIGNIWFANIGADFTPADKLKLTIDLWYASLVEEDQLGLDDADLGTEVDVKLTYEVVEGLNLDLIGAYLFAGDGTTEDADDDANPYELGARLSLSF